MDEPKERQHHIIAPRRRRRCHTFSEGESIEVNGMTVKLSDRDKPGRKATVVFEWFETVGLDNQTSDSPESH